jgi:hypothetical protein
MSPARSRTGFLFLALLLCLGLQSPAWAQGVYRWVDKEGVVHYSDQSQAGAERVEILRSPAPPAAPPAPAAPGTRPAPAAPAAPEAPVSCAVLAPTQDQAFSNVTSVTVSFSGPSGGTARLLLNGQEVQRGAAGSAFTVSPIYRGSYSAVVAIDGAGASGLVSCRTPAVTFHIRQASVIAPGRANPPRPTPRPAGR